MSVQRPKNMPQIIVNNVPYTFGPAVLAVNPKFETTIDVPWQVKSTHVMTILRSVMDGDDPVPKVSLGSHRDVYYTLKLAKVLNVFDTVVNKFMNWTLHASWTDLMNPEYLVLIEQLCPLLCDWKKFFSEYKLSYKTVVEKMLDLPELRVEPELWIKSLIFFKNFDFNTCFDELNDATRGRVSDMKRNMKKCSELFLINPYQDFLSGFFNYTPIDASIPIWSSDKVRAVRKFAVNESTLAPLDTFKERFHKFTGGHVASLADGTCIYAGGAIMKMLGVNYDPKHARQSDVDMFAGGYDYDTRKAYVKTILEHLQKIAADKSASIYFAYRGSVVSVYITNVNRKFQVITNDCSGKYGIIERFDTSHIQWMYDGTQVLGTPEALLAMREQVSRLHNTNRLKVQRLLKTLYCGYDIIKDETIVKNVIDITDLLTKPTTGDSDLARILRGFHGYYYPQVMVDDEDDPEIIKYQHMSAIEKDNNGFIVTDNPLNALDNLIVGGNFDNTYDSNMFTSFNPASVTNTGVRRGSRTERINNNLGTIRLLTGLLVVTNINNNDNGFEVICSIDEAFKRFLEIVNTDIFNKVAPGARLAAKLGATDTISFLYPKRLLDYSTKNGKSVLKSQHGRLLNIDEDIVNGDKIQVLFEIHAVIDYNANNMLLFPKQFIKHVNEVPVAVHDVKEELNEPVAVTADSVDYED